MVELSKRATDSLTEFSRSRLSSYTMGKEGEREEASRVLHILNIHPGRPPGSLS